jgi:serine/threonine protein kinase
MQTNINEQNQDSIGQYTLKHRCGQGAYGDVYCATDTISGRDVALKRIFKNQSNIDWEREFNGLRNYCSKNLSSNYLLNIYHIDENDLFFYYTMELADNRSPVQEKFVPDTLAKRLQKKELSLSQACEITKHLLHGLQLLHDNDLIHRDIKPENIIFVNNIPKLSDIGLVSAINSTRSISGTMGYIPPEVIMEALSTGTYKFNQQSDLYALGKVLYCISTGNIPEKYPSIPLALSKHEEMKLVNQIIDKACNKNHKKRFAQASEFRDAFKADVSSSAYRKKKQNKILFVIGLALLLSMIIFLINILTNQVQAKPESIPVKPEKIISYPQSGSFSTDSKASDDF